VQIANFEHRFCCPRVNQITVQGDCHGHDAERQLRLRVELCSPIADIPNVNKQPKTEFGIAGRTLRTYDSGSAV
jgi:hypothetical protein